MIPDEKTLKDLQKEGKDLDDKKKALVAENKLTPHDELAIELKQMEISLMHKLIDAYSKK